MTTRQVFQWLRQYESRNVTCIESDGSWPIVWERASGVHVWDAQGKRYLDLTAAFGVAAAGHANPRVVRAGRRQMGRLLHAMGDVHPHALKAQLARELSRITFERWRAGTTQGTGPGGKVIFCNSGFEAVEAALKTTLLATRRPGVIAFQGAYHGLGYGALNATHRELFRSPFRTQLREFGRFVPFPDSESAMVKTEKLIAKVLVGNRIGTVLVEPIQVRGGLNVPPTEFLQRLRRICDQHGALLILDEIYTGFGRTGRWFACEHAAVVPDLICLGKALTGGFPLSACVGRAEVMDAAWPASQGEAIHTSTFLGHPVGCAMALAEIKEIDRLNLVERSAELGQFLLRKLADLPARLSSCKALIRGQGLLVGVEFRSARSRPATALALQITKDMLRAGFLVLPEGQHSNVIGFTPPLSISRSQLESAVQSFTGIVTSHDYRPLPRLR